MMRRHLPPILVNRAFLPVWKTLKGDPVREIQRQLEEWEHWPHEERRKQQCQSLSELLISARGSVPVWRERISQDTIISAENAQEVLSLLPTTDKQCYRDWGDLAYRESDRSSWMASSTGGSTGEPFYFRCDVAAAPWRRANTARCLRWLGLEPGDPHAVLWGFALGASRMENIKGGVRDILSNQLALSSFAMDDQELDQHLSRLCAFGPRLLLGYPSALTVLAAHAVARGRMINGLRVALSSGEALFDSQREVIEAGFGVPVYNRYGSREFANVAHECQKRTGLHVLDDVLCVEILDDTDSPVAPGTLGELVITDLHNYAMPFIRYRTGDLAEWADEACECGRPQPLLRRVEGRAFDVIVTPSSIKIGGYFWTWLSRAVPGVAAFQVYQETPSGVELRIVPGDGWNSDGAQALVNHVRDTCGSEFAVDIREVEDIPLTPSGKHRFIVSKVGSTS